MSFLTYRDDGGTEISPPTIAELGGGWYGFLPTFSSSSRSLMYIIDGGPNANPAKLARYMRPEDWNSDYVPAVQQLAQSIKDHEQGRWEIPILGPNANCFIVYAPDGVTVLRKYHLLDAGGVPTTVNPYSRVPE